MTDCPVNRIVYGNPCDGPGTYYCDSDLWHSECRRYSEQRENDELIEREASRPEAPGDLAAATAQTVSQGLPSPLTGDVSDCSTDGPAKPGLCRNCACPWNSCLVHSQFCCDACSHPDPGPRKVIVLHMVYPDGTHTGDCEGCLWSQGDPR